MVKASARIYALFLRSAIHLGIRRIRVRNLYEKLTAVSFNSPVDEGLNCWIVGKICDVAIDGHFNGLVDHIDGDYEPLGGIVDLAIGAHLAEVEAHIGEDTVDQAFQRGGGACCRHDSRQQPQRGPLGM